MAKNTDEAGFPLVKVEIFKLFGCLDHVIELHKSGVSFMHGPNGSGKSTTLKILSSIFSLDLNYLNSISFSKISLRFDDRTELRIAKTFSENVDEGADEELMPAISFRLMKGRKIVEDSTIETKSESDDINVVEVTQKVREKFPHFSKVGPRMWKDRNLNRYYTMGMMAKLVGIAGYSSCPKWLSDLLAKTKIGVIQAQRLLDVRGSGVGDAKPDSELSIREVVEIYADEIKRKISEALTHSSIVSQQRERSFPQRLLSSKAKSEDEERLRTRYRDLQLRIQKLADAGLQETTGSIALPEKEFNETERRVLSLYLQDLNEKLDVYNELQGKIELMNSVFGLKLRRKSFSINRNDGFKIYDVEQKILLRPSQLSSGEQHLLVMYYQLIFSTSEPKLFLIDEPEISLHVEWQRRYLADLQAIAERCGHAFLIATHSPQIINGRLDLASALDGGIVTTGKATSISLAEG